LPKKSASDSDGAASVLAAAFGIAGEWVIGSAPARR